jgi:divalent metal cation (Fe/Co/Zn/Cd) transporter
LNNSGTDALWKTAWWLSGITVVYNIIEGVFSVIIGHDDNTLSLFGFGLDSFVEVVSGLGVWIMVARVRKNVTRQSSLEKATLKITGGSFYLLTIGLAIVASLNLWHHRQPETTAGGIVISTISILTMTILMSLKTRIGRKLASNAIIADANCTRTCVYLSIILLVSSVLFEIFKTGYIDSIGALGVAYYAYKEGKESFEKAKGAGCRCNDRS